MACRTLWNVIFAASYFYGMLFLVIFCCLQAVVRLLQLVTLRNYFLFFHTNYLCTRVYNFATLETIINCYSRPQG